jgi:hypothetical protein
MQLNKSSWVVNAFYPLNKGEQGKQVQIIMAR